jgi:hypothetical protein
MVRQEMAITVGKYHLFERERRGQVYFYYWYEAQGKRIQKACGHGCDDKRSAVAYMEQLLKADLIEARRQSSLASITVRDFAKDMFTEGAPPPCAMGSQGKSPETADCHPASPPLNRLPPAQVWSS